ncbi:hypothetical protein P4686_15650, partial [Terribacillus saccharophilus]|nr:hypothetical protein [Terribacillus saccharophilus]
MDNHMYTQNNERKGNNNMVAARIPGLIWIYVAFTASLIIQIVSGSSFLHYASFSFLIIIFSVLYWVSNRFLLKR